MFVKVKEILKEFVVFRKTNMKPRIFAVKLAEPIDDITFEFLLQFVSEEKKQRILKHVNKKDKDLIIIGDILARYAVNKVFGVKLLDIVFEISEYGKPYFKGHENMHFSISHSGDYVVCVVCDKPVGIDIQQIADIDFIPIAKRYFSKSEISCIETSTDKQIKFFELWAKKESYLKMLGIGIVDGLIIRYDNCSFEILDYFENHCISVCVSNKKYNNC